MKEFGLGARSILIKVNGRYCVSNQSSGIYGETETEKEDQKIKLWLLRELKMVIE